METLIELASASGIWAVLFVVLFVYQIQDSKKREGKYQGTISQLAESLSVVIEIKDDVDSIVKHIFGEKPPQKSEEKTTET